MITASTFFEPSIASLNASKSSGPYLVGRHIRGLWWKIWIASQPRSSPRVTALTSPPAVDTWHPIHIVGPSYVGAALGRCRPPASGAEDDAGDRGVVGVRAQRRARAAGSAD